MCWCLRQQVQPASYLLALFATVLIPLPCCCCVQCAATAGSLLLSKLLRLQPMSLGPCVPPLVVQALLQLLAYSDTLTQVWAFCRADGIRRDSVGQRADVMAAGSV